MHSTSRSRLNNQLESTQNGRRANPESPFFLLCLPPSPQDKSRRIENPLEFLFRFPSFFPSNSPPQRNRLTHGHTRTCVVFFFTLPPFHCVTALPLAQLFTSTRSSHYPFRAPSFASLSYYHFLSVVRFHVLSCSFSR